VQKEGDAFSVALTYLIVATSLFPLQNVIAKRLLETYPVEEIIWSRFFFYFIAIAPIVLSRFGTKVFIPAEFSTNIVRAILLTFSGFFLYLSLQTVPVADSIAVLYVYPLLITALSPFVLGERVARLQWFAVGLGFTGVCVLLRPGAGAVSPGALFALASGASIALAMVLTRKLSVSNDPLATLFFSGMIGALATSAMLPFIWIVPSWEHWVLMAAMGLTAAIGHYLLILAYGKAPASTLAPFAYWEVIATTALGYALLGSPPDSVTWIGASIICTGGIINACKKRPR
jgi:drug/metabolite transporter (DMT)-like permease